MEAHGPMISEPDPQPGLQPDRFAFLHIDLNSFFASVEQQLHPEYRGRPLAVVPTHADTTCCIAASYEAKALGIKTGTQVGEAKRVCPEIVLIEGNHNVYAEYSHRIAEAVERCCPVAHTPSIDEMVCELMGREQEPPRARRRRQCRGRGASGTAGRPRRSPTARACRGGRARGAATWW